MSDLATIANEPPVGERMMRIEALFESALTNQARRDREESERRRDQADDLRRRDAHATKQRRELTRAIHDILKRMERLETVILGDAARGGKAIDERIKGIEDVILSARASWRTLALAATAAFGLFSTIAYSMQRFGDLWPKHHP